MPFVYKGDKRPSQILEFWIHVGPARPMLCFLFFTAAPRLPPKPRLEQEIMVKSLATRPRWCMQWRSGCNKYPPPPIHPPLSQPPTVLVFVWLKIRMTKGVLLLRGKGTIVVDFPRARSSKNKQATKQPTNTTTTPWTSANLMTLLVPSAIDHIQPPPSMPDLPPRDENRKLPASLPDRHMPSIP
jgi:hypothetical protein